MTRKRLGDLLVERGVITQQQLNDALVIQEKTGERLGNILVAKGIINEDQLLEAVSERLGIPKLSLGQLVIDPQVVQRVPVEIARRYTIIPIFAIGNTITLAMADPLNIIAIDEIRYQTNADIKRTIARADEIREAIDRYYSVADSLNEIIANNRETARPTKIAPLQVVSTESNESEAPIVRLVNLIISKAVKDKASDIHIEPDEDTLRVRYRIHGGMREEASPPKSMQSEILSRIKVSANLDLSEKRIPQDGRMGVSVDGHSIDLRISTLPTIHGEKIVIRILDRRNLHLTFQQLGFRPKMLAEWLHVVKQPEGLILITGPTSSGKTTTLYTTLQEINSIEKNIITVEDPVEYSLPLINQVQINEKAGLSFPAALRSMLRQNPDIVMIGEVRDTETAKIAVRSSLTGHLVFSTIHTNDAPSTVARLLDMGIEPYLLASALKGILAQRLVRTNCSECSAAYQPPATLLQRAGITELSDVIEFKKGAGCRKCKGSGFSGMTGIYEYLEITAPISEAILTGASANRLRELAKKNGFLTLFESGLEKLTSGILCLEELLKETSNAEDYLQPALSGSLSQ